jgi:puromycin-sensitive aminopeptidase
LEATRPVEFTVTSPEEAESMFDALTYGKGAAVVRMLERFVGAQAFREGITQYLSTHAHGNAETEDLWVALQSISHVDVASLMEGWIRRGGYPIITVIPTDSGARLVQEQFLFQGEGDQLWEVPLLYRHLDAGDTGSLVLGRSATIDLPASGLIVNAGGHGFYRVRYAPELLHSIGDRFGELDAMERNSIIADTWALVLRGDEPAAEVLRILAHVGNDPEPVIWEAVSRVYRELDHIASPAAGKRLQAHIASTMGPALDAMGFEPAPGEDALTRRKRGVLLAALGVLGDDAEVQRRLRSLFDADMGVRVDADVLNAAVWVVGGTGDMADYDRLIELYKRADSPQDEIRYLHAATSIPIEQAADRTFEMVLAGDVRSQDGAGVFARLLGNRTVGPHVWSLWTEHWDEMVGLFPIGMRRRLLDFLPNRTEPELAEEIRAFLNDHPLAGGERYKSQQLERMSLRVALRRREYERLGVSG